MRRKLGQSRIIPLVVLLVVLAGSALGRGEASTNSTVPQRTTPGSQAQADPATYVIGAEDVLAVNIWREPEISRSVPVRPDGKITLPLIGDLETNGRTPLQLQAEITSRLEKYLNHPEVTVIVQEVKSPRFNLVGEVVRPGAYLMTKPMTVLDAIANAGGFRDFAKPSKIYVLRMNADGTRSRLPFNYKQVVKGKNPAQDIELRIHDTIVVP
jgi:polysaccharide export outer membrane protein